MNSQKRNTQNLNLKEENSSCFYSWGLQQTIVKKCSSSPSLFFCRYQTSSFCITLSNCALQLVYIGKVNLPLLGDDSGVVIVSLLILITSVGLLWQAGVWHGSERHAPLLKPVWKPVLNCQNLATWFSYTVIWWINLKVPKGLMITSGTVVQHVKVHAWLY